jgi:hypothetical protein
MSEVLAYAQTLVEDETTLILSGLVLVFVLQLIVFRWAEWSHPVTAVYFVTTVAFVGGPIAATLVETPDRVFNISDREVVWAFLSFLATIVGIACSRSRRRQSSAVTRSARPSGSAQLKSAHALPT